LVNAAANAGARVREEFNVDELIFSGSKVCGVRGHFRGRHQESVTARVVIGADGRGSQVAKAVRASSYDEKPRLQWAFYTYFRDLPVDGFETYVRPFRAFAAAPTNDGLSMVVASWPYAEARAYKADVEGNYHRTLELVPNFGARVKRATREEQFLGGAVPNYFRTPFGPGWALVGDAGYNTDPITAQGISDAFRDAEQCSAAVHQWLSGQRSFEDAFHSWHQARDRKVLAMYEFTTRLATLEPPPAEMQQLLGAICGNQPAMDDFVSVNAGTLSPDVFFSPEHISRAFEAATIPS
jgi:2-polyprenyl-6-methoxyphenol hydroxylase-like FAD-dependent oxidoreductase